jgi:hypothetical protein
LWRTAVSSASISICGVTRSRNGIFSVRDINVSSFLGDVFSAVYENRCG